MHTQSLAGLKRQLIRKKMIHSAKESIKQQASNSEIYGKMQTVFIEMESYYPNMSLVVKELENLEEAVMKNKIEGENTKSTFDPENFKIVVRQVQFTLKMKEQRTWILSLGCCEIFCFWCN